MIVKWLPGPSRTDPAPKGLTNPIPVEAKMVGIAGRQGIKNIDWQP